MSVWRFQICLRNSYFAALPCVLCKYSYFKLISSIGFDFSQWFIRSLWLWLRCYLAFFSSMLEHANFFSIRNLFEIFHFCQHPILLVKCQHCTWLWSSLPYKFLGTRLSEQIEASPPCCLLIIYLMRNLNAWTIFFKCLHQALLIIFLDWMWLAVTISICFRCCWISSSLELNSQFRLNRLIPNFYTASCYDPIFSGWNFYSWWSQWFFLNCFNLKNDSKSNSMQSHHDCGEINPSRTVDSWGVDTTVTQGFMKKLFFGLLSARELIINSLSKI